MSYLFIDPEILKKLRDEYKPGTRVELIEMNDPYRDMPSGLKGIVKYVDDIGSIHVAWNNGSNLAVIYGVDYIRRIKNILKKSAIITVFSDVLS